MKRINFKKFKYGAGSTVVIITLVVCAVLLNIIASLIEDKVPQLRFDLTEDSVTKLSDETKNVLTELNATDTDISVIQLVGTSGSDDTISDVLQEYAVRSENIKKTEENYVKNPTVLNEYGVDSQYADNAVIVTGNNKTKVITQYDMWPEAQSYGALGYGKFMLESLMTNAIGYIINENAANVVISEGHDEADPTVLQYTLQNENVTVSTLDISTSSIPDTCDLFMILGPQKDFTQIEIDALDTYLSNGGSAAVALTFDNELPKLESYLKDWGLIASNDIILEKDSSASFQQSGMYFYPTLGASTLTEGIGQKILVSYPRSLTVEETGDISATPIMTTSSDAYSIPIVDHDLDDQNMTRSSFTIGYLLEKPLGNSLENTAKLIVTSTPSAWGVLNSMTTEYDQYILYALTTDSFGTKDFVMNTVSYASGIENVSVAVPDKSVSISVLNLSAQEKSLYGALLCVVIPIAILAAGVIVWLKRRHL